MHLQITDRHAWVDGQLSREDDARNKTDHAAHLIYIVLRLRPLAAPVEEAPVLK